MNSHNFSPKIKCYEPNHQCIHFISPFSKFARHSIESLTPKCLCESRVCCTTNRFYGLQTFVIKDFLVINKLVDVANRVDGFKTARMGDSASTVVKDSRLFAAPQNIFFTSFET